MRFLIFFTLSTGRLLYAADPACSQELLNIVQHALIAAAVQTQQSAPGVRQKLINFPAIERLVAKRVWGVCRETGCEREEIEQVAQAAAEEYFRDDFTQDRGWASRMISAGAIVAVVGGAFAIERIAHGTSYSAVAGAILGISVYGILHKLLASRPQPRAPANFSGSEITHSLITAVKRHFIRAYLVLSQGRSSKELRWSEAARVLGEAALKLERYSRSLGESRDRILRDLAESARNYFVDMDLPEDFRDQVLDVVLEGDRRAIEDDAIRANYETMIEDWLVPPEPVYSEYDSFRAMTEHAPINPRFGG